MHYLLLGEDSLAKDQVIEKVKQQVFGSLKDKATYQNALNFDYNTIHADKLNPADLKKALMELPTVSPQRILIIRNIHKLSTQNKELLLAFFDGKQDYLVCIFDTFEADAKNAFLKKLVQKCKVSNFHQKEHLNVFDITKAISSRKPAQALKQLRELFSNGDHPLQIMGGLIWYWGRTRNRLSKDAFYSGLKYLQEADLNIKRTRMNGESALELVVVKLCSLIAC